MNSVQNILESDRDTVAPYHISEEENRRINAILDRLMEREIDPESTSFLIRAPYYAHQLPKALIDELYAFKYRDNSSGIIVFSGFRFVDTQGNLRPVEDLIGRTPTNHLQVDKNEYLIKTHLLFVLLSSILGDVFGWNSQHNGKLINNILPVPGNEKEQLSTASETTLEWHTEEAFHEFRADNLGLFCLRNRDQVATTVCAIDELELPDDIVRELFRKKYIFFSDNNFNNEASEPSLQSVLFGSVASPYLRIDPAFMAPIKGDAKAEEALAYITDHINGNLKRVVLQTGEFCFIDNHRAVHGREKFRPRYDGTDRWLKRVNITRDLIKSRSLRDNETARVLH